MKEKVLVGISGGVDSSVACALLKEGGYAVSAVFLRFWDPARKNNKALADAKKVCAVLDIPLTTIDARAGFRKTVVKYFLDEYGRGNTPNPCVFCNEKMKFKLLFETAKKMRVDFVATGHYARIKKNKNVGKDSYKLFPGKDVQKDQSYFLYRLKQEQLARIIFPLGEYKKEVVRKLAEKFQLPVSEKSDSQDVCFMANNSLEKFLAKKIKLKKGEIVDLDGKVLGRHRGLPLYTIGQRKGIEIGGNGPYFVVAKNIKKNELVVTNKLINLETTQKVALLKDVTWNSDNAPELTFEVGVRTRYHNPLVRAIISYRKGQKTCQVEFAVSQKAISPGQSVVFYGKDEEILGGGIIE